VIEVAKNSKLTERRLKKGRGLCKLSPEMIAQAEDETTASIMRIMLTLVGAALFCILSLLTPDISLLIGDENLNVPLAGPVSFLGFIVVGPAVLIALRIYLQIYVEHWYRLESVRRRMPAADRPPSLSPVRNPILRAFAAFTLYLLLPLTMLAFTWKAFVLPGWGQSLLYVTVAVTAVHIVLPFRWDGQVKALLSIAATVFTAALVYDQELPLRPFNLFRADLSQQWLVDSTLPFANLKFADLQRATLWRAELEHAFLWRANLKDADLKGADLKRADLKGADLEGAVLWNADLNRAVLKRTDLEGAILEGAILEGADLEGASLLNARNLKQKQLEEACLNEATELPPGYKLPRSGYLCRQRR
jgi:hypothetical protein